MEKLIRVLFVCTGNIYRSPMAEAVFRHQVKEAGLSEIIDVESAGTGSWHVGQRPHPLQVAADAFGASRIQPHAVNGDLVAGTAALVPFNAGRRVGVGQRHADGVAQG